MTEQTPTWATAFIPAPFTSLPVRYHYKENLPAWLPNGPIPISLMIHRNRRRSARCPDRGPLWVTRIWLN